MRYAWLAIVLAGCTAWADFDQRADAGTIDAGGQGDAGIDGGPDASADAGLDAGDGGCDGEIPVLGDITADTTWSCGVYVLSGVIAVRSGATLTVVPPARVEGVLGSVLVVHRDGALRALGTPEAPVVFAANGPGRWGGVYLLGEARINRTPVPHDLDDFPAGAPSFGGVDDADDCGTLQYVRIEHTGTIYPGGSNTLDGLTLAGCGSETTIDHVQVHDAADDGVRILGGTVALRHVVITGPGEDGLDWDYGWTGSVQYLVIQIGPSAQQAIEGSSNDGALPISAPILANATLIGNRGGGARAELARLTRGTAMVLTHSVMRSFASGIDVNDAATADVTGRPADPTGREALRLDRSFLHQFGSDDVTWFPPEGAPGNDEGFDEAAYFLDADFLNTTGVPPELGTPASPTAPDFAPSPSAPLDVPSPTTDPRIETTSYAGAIEPGGTDWTLGWTAYP